MVGIPNRDRRAERREATRLEILDAAWDVSRQNGIAGLTLREVAVRVGMQPPSLYSHFDSKNAVYDAMFFQAWQTYADVVTEQARSAPSVPRDRLTFMALSFFDFAVADVARSQLMNSQVVPDFRPTDAAYAPAIRVLEMLRSELAALGITDEHDVDLYTALLDGLVSQQLANDRGGHRWRDLVPRAMDMYADGVGLPRRRTRSSGRTT